MRANWFKKSIIIFFTVLLGCKNDDISDPRVKVTKFDKGSTVQLIENDSTRTVINIKDGKILSIAKYKNDKINGEILSFFPSGFLAKKRQVDDGSSNGHYYEFYESGSMAFHNYYCNIYPCHYGVELWEEEYEVMKKQIYYGERGKIDKTRTYDSLGNFIKDSIPY